MSTDEDTSAIQRCKDGDIDALASLIARYHLSALRLAYLLTGDHFLAEDIVQDSFLKAYREIKQFDMSRPFAPWFLRIVTNCARLRYRTMTRRVEVSLEDLKADESGVSIVSPMPGPEVNAVHGEQRDALHAALSALTTYQREAIILRYYYSYADGEIAEIIGCRIASARQRLYSGLHALEKIIRQRYPWLLDEFPIISHLSKEAHHAE